MLFSRQNFRPLRLLSVNFLTNKAPSCSVTITASFCVFCYCIVLWAVCVGVLYLTVTRVTLEVFLENPKIELTNNTAERAIKPFVIGRKNWLFCNTPDGARASAIIYSIIETAKANNLNPLAHLEQIFEKLQKDCAPTECQPEN